MHTMVLKTFMKNTYNEKYLALQIFFLPLSPNKLTFEFNFITDFWNILVDTAFFS